MDVNKDFDEILNNSHWLNWGPDLMVVKDVYNEFPDSYSVLTPFMYTYLEELIRSTTSEYGRELKDNPKRVGIALINLAKNENSENKKYLKELTRIEKYFTRSTGLDSGDNRNSTAHGYMHPRYWSKESFEALVNDVAKLSKFAKF